MTDAHFHRSGATFASVGGREFRFCGMHPWDAESADIPAALEEFRSMLEADPSMGVGEIGLDRLKARTVTPKQREAFAAQLALAAEMGRPVVLHGAKCWGQVVAECRRHVGVIPAFLFHGFSRSGGLLGDMAALNGFVSVGPAVLNDHAVNYRELVKKIPAEMLLLETDRTVENEAECPAIEEIARKVAEMRGLSFEELEALIERNAERFCGNS